MDAGAGAAIVSRGGQVRLTNGNSKEILTEGIGFRDGRAGVMPGGQRHGMGLAARACCADTAAAGRPITAGLGRVVDGFGARQDGKESHSQGRPAYPVSGQVLSAHLRCRVGGKAGLGVRSLDAVATCCRGKRSLPGGRTLDAQALIARAPASMADHDDIAGRIRRGAYTPGSRTKVAAASDAVLTRNKNEKSTFAASASETVMAGIKGRAA